MEVFHVSELVKFRGNDCVIMDIRKNSFGWNDYEIWDLNTGQSTVTQKIWLQKSTIETLNFSELLSEEMQVVIEDSVPDMEDCVKIQNEIQDVVQNAAGVKMEMQSRHSVLKNEDLDTMAKANQEKNTVYSTHWAVNVFKNWLVDRDHSTDFEDLASTELSDLLRRFYGEVNNSKSGQYSRSALIGIRAGINRHMQNPPFNKTINIVTDKDFMAANKVLTGRVKINRENGFDVTKHKTAIAPDDLKKMYASGTLSNTNPVFLQYKVFFELSYHFGRRGKEGLHKLKRDSFIFVNDDIEDGIEYATLSFNEKSKKNQGTDNKRKEKDDRMYSQNCDPLCPVTSLKLYLSKLNPACDNFFQRPKYCQNATDLDVWYTSRPIGVNTLSKMMKYISSSAKLSQVYTNHCIRATTSTVLAHADINQNDIISVTGHKDPKSLLPYVSATSNLQRKNMSSILHAYGRTDENISSRNIKSVTAAAAVSKNPDQTNMQSLASGSLVSVKPIDRPVLSTLAENSNVTPGACNFNSETVQHAQDLP